MDAQHARGPRGSIHVRGRIALLLGVAAIAFVLVIALVQRTENAQVDLLMQERVAQTERSLDDILELKASGARVHADDYTRWDEFVSFARRPDRRWAEINLTQNIGTFGLESAWVLNKRFELIYTANPSKHAGYEPLPAPWPALREALMQQPIRHFFAPSRAGLLEIWTSPIHPSDDFERETPLNGYYVVARTWTQSRVAEIARLMRGRVSLLLPQSGTGLGAWAETGDIRLARALPGLDGRPVAVLTLDTNYPLAPRVHEALRHSMVLMIAGGAIALFLVTWTLTRWVMHPLSRITDSLRREDAAALRNTTSLRDEFGDLARLVRDFFIQQKHLIEAREQAESAVQAKSRFVAAISHELRTPMQGVLSYARFGTQEAETADRDELLEYFSQIEDCGKTLLLLLDDLLDLSKFEAGRMKLELAETHIEDIANDAASEFERLFGEKKVTLGIRISDGLTPIVADRMRLRQVFRNLLSNAAKFTPAGGQVTLTARDADGRVLVSVEDTGRGIPPGELETIFERFRQATTNTVHAGGTGLGLALCREIVQAHGGRIWAENAVPRGARFVIALPIEGPGPGREDTPHDAVLTDETAEGSTGQAAA